MSYQKDKIKPIIFWEGFPVCGLLLKKVADELKENLIITATRPAVSFGNLENILGHKIIWLDDANDIWKRREEFNDRNLIIHTGWVHKGWRKYDAHMKKRTGAKTVAMVDNRFRGDLRQILGAVYFRLFFKKYFDATFVPGKSGRKLMKFLGMHSSRIYSPNYGAYEGIYKETKTITKREKEFLFVGQLINRKGVNVLLEAFDAYRRGGRVLDAPYARRRPIKEYVQGRWYNMRKLYSTIRNSKENE